MLRRPASLLLVLDNCEHLVSASAHLADAVMRACPSVRIMVTSREPLAIAGELTYRIPPLSLPGSDPQVSCEHLMRAEAVRLFVERASSSARSSRSPSGTSGRPQGCAAAWTGCRSRSSSQRPG